MIEKKQTQKKSHFKRNGKSGEHPYGDLGQIIILCSFLLIWILDSFVFHYSTVLSQYVPFYLRLIVAGLIFAYAIYLASSGHRAVSDDALSSPQLLTEGAFALMRHPLYLASLLFYLFLIATSLSLISMLLFIGVFIFYNTIAAYEENYLESKFGQDYCDYKRAVPKWIPRLHKSRRLDRFEKVQK
jgi:protein-S-isoprenylcysteine O-methyltransferase Ste14